MRETQQAGTWESTTWDGGQHVHVMPVDDLLEHQGDDDGVCICGPQTVPVDRTDGTTAWMYVHASLDGREASEQ